MTIQEFIASLQEAFGDKVQLPVAFSFSDTPLTEPKEGLRCIMGAFPKVRKGSPVTLADKFLTCGGGMLYLGTATIAVDFGGHGKSQGKKVNMTIAKEIVEAKAVYDYASSLPYVTKDKMVPLWCSKKYDGIYKDSHLHLVEGEVHTMHKKLDKTIDIIDNFMKQ